MIAPADLIFHEYTDVEDHFDNDELVFMQFTGLLDKNGKETYEGDIVTIEYKDFEDQTKGRNAEVYFQDYRACWAVKPGPHTNQDMYVYTKPGNSIEVIGNVHENPELLK